MLGRRLERAHAGAIGLVQDGDARTPGAQVPKEIQGDAVGLARCGRPRGRSRSRARRPPAPPGRVSRVAAAAASDVGARSICAAKMRVVVVVMALPARLHHLAGQAKHGRGLSAPADQGDDLVAPHLQRFGQSHPRTLRPVVRARDRSANERYRRSGWSRVSPDGSTVSPVPRLSAILVDRRHQDTERTAVPALFALLAPQPHPDRSRRLPPGPMTDREAGPREEYRRREAGHRERAAGAARREETISRAPARRRAGRRAARVAGVRSRHGSRRGGSWRRRGRSRPCWSLTGASGASGVRPSGLPRTTGRGLARLDGQWAGTGRTGTRFADPHHPYADDLDILGEGSLYELRLRGAHEHGRGDAGRHGSWRRPIPRRLARDRPPCRRWHHAWI